jgi:TIR domain
MPHTQAAIPAVFDVFFSYNSEERDAVRAIREYLVRNGVRVWVDWEDLIPGGTWDVDVVDAIRKSKTVAVFVGPRGIGRIQQKEISYAHGLTDRHRRIVPVCLPGGPEVPDLPGFLPITTVVRFLNGVDESHPLKALQWGITDVKPPPDPAPGEPPQPSPTSVYARRRSDDQVPELVRAMQFKNPTVIVGARAMPPLPTNPTVPYEISEELMRELQCPGLKLLGTHVGATDCVSTAYAPRFRSACM